MQYLRDNIDRKRGKGSGLSKSLVVQSFGWRPTNYKWRQRVYILLVSTFAVKLKKNQMCYQVKITVFLS